MVTSFDGGNELQDNENKKIVELYKVGHWKLQFGSSARIAY